MRKAICQVILIFAFVLASIEACSASTQQFFTSFIDAIDTADVDANVTMEKGVWKSSRGDVDLIWSLPRKTIPKLRLYYEQGTVVSNPELGHINYIQFPKEPGIGNTFIDVTVIKRSGDQRDCATFRIFRLEFDTGGTINGNSDVQILPSSPNCRGEGSFFDLPAFLNIADTPSAVFKGRVFTALDEFLLSKCDDKQCRNSRRTRGAGPISEFRLMVSKDGITLKSQAEIRFSDSATIRLSPGSHLNVRFLHYYVAVEKGEADFSDTRFNISEGLIVVGKTTLSLKRDLENINVLYFPTLLVKRDSDLLTTENGQMDVGLATGSSISLVSEGGDSDSRILIDSASAHFFGLGFRFSNSEGELFAKQAKIDLAAQSITLGFSSDNWLKLGYTGFNLILGCTQSSMTLQECSGFSWSRTGTNLVGVITKLSAQINQGRFAIGQAGFSQVRGGEIYSESLLLDTRRATPIHGRLENFAIDVFGDDFWVDQKTRFKAAQLTLRSDDIKFLPDQKYPIGRLRMQGTITQISTGQFEEFQLREAKIDALVGRSDSTRSAEVFSGLIDAKLALRGDSQAVADGYISLTHMHYYQGSGGAILSFAIESASGEIVTPGKVVKVDGFLESTVDLKSIKIAPVLQGALRKEGLVVQAQDGKWAIDPISLDFSLSVPIASQELLYVLVEPDIGPNCASRVKFSPETYTFWGHIEIDLSKPAYRIGDFAIDREIQIDVDGGSCEKAIKVVCFIAGSVGNVFVPPPFGNVAAAVLCGQEIDKKKKELTGKFHEAVRDKIRSAEFRSRR